MLPRDADTRWKQVAPMKMRDLAREAVGATVPAWPPLWTGAPYHRALPMPGEGLLESVTRSANTLLRLTMRFEGNEYTGFLAWDGPPRMVAVESLLTANLGRSIGAIGALDI
jgi:hypothetical protein